jgi:hypothetical protein
MLDELFCGNACLLENAGKCTGLEFLVVRHNAPSGTSPEDYVASFLASDRKAHLLQSGQALSTSDPG